MAEAVHRVRRIHWRVRAATEGAGRAVRARLRAGAADLTTGLAAAFDAHDDGEDIVHIPRLEVRTHVDEGQLDQRLAAVVLAALRRQLDALVTAGGGRHRMHAEVDAEILTAYLHDGLPPWQLAADPPAAAARLRAVARAEPRAALATLARLDWPRRREAVRRLLQLLEPSDWPGLGAPSAPSAGADAPLETALRLIAASSERSLAVRERLAATLLAVGGDADRPQAAHEAAACLADGAIDAPLVAALAAYLGAPAALASRAAPEIRPATPSSTSPAMAAAAGMAGTAARSPHIAAAAPLAAELSCMIPYAGLVLLHPFLPRLLSATGLWAGGAAPLVPATVAPAAALLAYLASGRHAPLDLDLPFIKVLLGLRPESPLPLGSRPLGPDDLTEVETLLDAAVTHWTALGRSSAAALRATFLQRTGRLTEDELGWRLDVEPRGPDVLLDRLPWGFRAARLPWMRRPIVTTWPAP